MLTETEINSKERTFVLSILMPGKGHNKTVGLFGSQKDALAWANEHIDGRICPYKVLPFTCVV